MANLISSLMRSGTKGDGGERESDDNAMYSVFHVCCSDDHLGHTGGVFCLPMILIPVIEPSPRHRPILGSVSDTGSIQFTLLCQPDDLLGHVVGFDCSPAILPDIADPSPVIDRS